MDDLNLFGRHSGTSVYRMFDRTFTRGGAVLLEEMFRFPLSDAAAINRRCSFIRYFSAMPAFPFDTELFDIAEQYLAETDQRTKLSHEDNTVVQKLSQLIAETPGHKFVSTGVSACITILAALREFVGRLMADKGSPCRTEAETIMALLEDPAFLSLPKGKNKLPHTALAQMDVLLRFRHRLTLMKLLGFIYLLDVYISVGRIAVQLGLNFPEALPREEHKLDIGGLYHPMMKGAVPNDFRLSPETNVIFLTGANMAGKSTFMKSLGTGIYLAHMGFPVAAKRMEFSVMDGLFTTINLPDNLASGTSHFYAEVLRIKKVAKELNLGKDLFVIVDELFRGTNVKDAYEATIAITEGFAKKRNSLFVISTHIIEAGEVLRSRCGNIGFRYLPTRMTENTPVYTYTLHEGITDDRHGMIIIQNEGILELLRNKKTRLHELQGG